MSEITVYNSSKEKVGTVMAPAELDQKANGRLLHQVVVAQLTNRRHGTSKVKSRREVAGSTRKIIRQKGTGGARHGDIKAPLFVGGGRAFGPKPKDYDVRLPQKIRSAALKEAVLLRKNEGRFWVVDQLKFDSPKTKQAAEIFRKLEIPGALLVIEGGLEALEKSVRNLEKFGVCRYESLSVLDILRYDHLVMTKAVYEKFVSQFVAAGGAA
jgi:large subunit ribosomal protein L4